MDYKSDEKYKQNMALKKAMQFESLAALYDKRKDTMQVAIVHYRRARDEYRTAQDNRKVLEMEQRIRDLREILTPTRGGEGNKMNKELEREMEKEREMREMF